MNDHSFAYLLLPSDRRQAPFLVSNYAPLWTAHYMEHAYRLRDPVIRHSLRVFDLFNWGWDIAGEFGVAARDLFHEAEFFGIRCGVTIPVRECPNGPAAMTFVTDQRRLQYLTCAHTNAFALHFIAVHFHKHLNRILQPTVCIAGVALTQREVELLEWASHGKSRADISDITGIRKRIVVRDLESAKAKLGVRITCQAIRVYAAGRANRDTKAD